MLAIIASNDILLTKFNNIKSIKGIGDISDIALVHLFISYPDAYVTSSNKCTIST